MQKFLHFFENRGINPELKISYKGPRFTVTLATAFHRPIDGEGPPIEFVAEGIARRSIDKPDELKAEQISGGRAIKALYLKIKYYEDKVNIGLMPVSEQSEALHLLEKNHKRLVQGHLHLLMG